MDLSRSWPLIPLGFAITSCGPAAEPEAGAIAAACHAPIDGAATAIARAKKTPGQALPIGACRIMANSTGRIAILSDPPRPAN